MQRCIINLRPFIELLEIDGINYRGKCDYEVFGVLSKRSNEQHAEHIHTHSCIEIISINNQQPATNYNTIHKYLSAKHMFYHWTTKQYKTDILLLVSSTT